MVASPCRNTVVILNAKDANWLIRFHGLIPSQVGVVPLDFNQIRLISASRLPCSVAPAFGSFGESETRQIGRDDTISVSKTRD